MKKIAFLNTILGLSISTTLIVPVLSSCSQSNNAELSQAVIDKGVSIKTANLQKGKDSTIELNLPENEKIEEVELLIGGLICTKGLDVCIDGSLIWISAKCMVESKVTINSIKFYKRLSGLDITTKTSREVHEVMTASDLDVRLAYNDGSKSETPLTWDYDYSISKDGQEIKWFDTDGYTFTRADAKAGAIVFTLQYKGDASITGTFSVNVVDGPYTQEEFFEQYSKFLVNYSEIGVEFKNMNFATGSKYIAKDVTKADITYSSETGIAVATFDCETPNSKSVAGQTVKAMSLYLSYFDDETHKKEFTITDDYVEYKITLKSDESQYEQVRFDKYTFIRHWVNTFVNTNAYTYAGTDLQTITYN